jgi:hypothetical protein
MHLFCFILFISFFESVVTNIENLDNFEFQFNPEYNICRNFTEQNKLDLLIYVHSNPYNYRRRILIRETWAKRSLFPNIRIIFVMGLASLSEFL